MRVCTFKRSAFCEQNEERNRVIKSTGREGRKEGLRNVLTFLTKEGNRFREDRIFV